MWIWQNRSNFQEHSLRGSEASAGAQWSYGAQWAHTTREHLFSKSSRLDARRRAREPTGRAQWNNSNSGTREFADRRHADLGLPEEAGRETTALASLPRGSEASGTGARAQWEARKRGGRPLRPPLCLEANICLYITIIYIYICLYINIYIYR